MSRRPMYKFRLYVAGDALNAAHALANLAPSPVRRIVGTLSQADTVLRALGIGAVAA